MSGLYCVCWLIGYVTAVLFYPQKAFCVMENVAEEINRQKRHHESLNRFKDIQNNLAGWSVSWCLLRFFGVHFICVVQPGKGDGHTIRAKETT